MYISIQKISLPLFFSCTILKKQDNYIAYYKSKKFFFFFKISNDKAMLFKDSCSLSVSSEYFQIKKNVNYTQFLLITLLKSWEMHFFKKFKFKSKGLKIKRKKTFTFIEVTESSLIVWTLRPLKVLFLNIIKSNNRVEYKIPDFKI